jgi:hypothetical protein
MENFNSPQFEELTDFQLKEIEAGNPIVIGLLASWAGTILYECVNDWNANVAAFNAGKKSIK